jgi:hypothetical protein
VRYQTDVRVSLLSIVITIAPNLFADAPHIFKLQKVVESSDLVVVATVQANLETNSGVQRFPAA